MSDAAGFALGVADARARRLRELARARLPGAERGLRRLLAEDRLTGEDAAIAWRLFADAHSLELEGHGDVPTGATVADRFLGSETFQAWAADGTGLAVRDCPPVCVVSARELADTRLAAITDTTPFNRQVLQVDIPPLPARVQNLVQVIPTEGREVKRTTLTAPDPVGLGSPPIDSDGAAETVATATPTPQLLFRWATFLNVDNRAMKTDQAYARERISTLITRLTARALEAELLAGAGTTTGTRRQLLGILNVLGLNAFALSSGTRTDALLEGVALVGEDGFHSDGYQVVGHPRTLRNLYGEPDWRRDRFPSVTSIVESDKIAAGTVLVGSFREARLYVENPGLMLEITDSHASNFTAGVMTLAAVMYVYLDCPFPAAFARLTNM